MCGNSGRKRCATQAHKPGAKEGRPTKSAASSAGKHPHLGSACHPRAEDASPPAKRRVITQAADPPIRFATEQSRSRGSATSMPKREPNDDRTRRKHHRAPTRVSEKLVSVPSVSSQVEHLCS